MKCFFSDTLRKCKRYTYHDAEWFFIFWVLFEFFCRRTYFIIKLHDYSFFEAERWQLLGGSVNAVLGVLIAGTCQTAGHRGCVGPGFPGVWGQGYSCFSKWQLFLPPKCRDNTVMWCYYNCISSVTVSVHFQILRGESGDSVFNVRASVYS